MTMFVVFRCSDFWSIARKQAYLTQASELSDCLKRFPVRLHNSLRPPDRPGDSVYWMPLKKFSNNMSFCAVSLGVNTLGSVASRICKSLDFTGYLSNLSVLPKAETRLFYADLCERPPIQTTGHRSTTVRVYDTRKSNKSGCNLGYVACKRNNSENSDRAKESATDNVVINWKSVFMIMESLSPSSCRRDAAEQIALWFQHSVFCGTLSCIKQSFLSL